ncbi:MAG: hypothetical protein Barrevirus1_29 [Barrevirus sp.]|uniref:Right handed beta helix domain-containing protein n=1 Tax=Barrevirus sp. TaxID=2487763 RepID=A0A3G4ZPJ5_9VIRU|nr:MAG: hypothetical protein Barrevirus1_29 [Barrevirus sp.]
MTKRSCDCKNKNERHGCGCNSTNVDQCKMNKAGQNLILTKSGNYTLSENVKGTIVVAANSVCIDLCCHILDANGAANAIIASGFSDLSVSNGTIKNSSATAIMVDTYINVTFENLKIHDYIMNGIDITSSTNVVLQDVALSNKNSGERALFLSKVKNFSFVRGSATGFLSTMAAVVEIDICKDITLTDVNIFENTKAYTIDTSFNVARGSIISINSSDGISLTRLNANRNIINPSNAVTGTRRSTVMNMFQSTNITVQESEFCSNVEAGGGLNARTSILRTDSCSHVTVKNTKTNNNHATAPIVKFRMNEFTATVANGTNLVVEYAQANENIADELVVTAAGSANSELTGFFVGSIAGLDGLMRYCQANDNVVKNGGSPRTTTLGNLNPIEIAATGVIVDTFQASNNVMNTILPNQFVNGIITNGSTDIDILNSTADNNSGGFVVYAFQTFSGSDRITLKGCSARNNRGYGIAIGDPLFLDDFSNNVTIVDSFFLKNFHDTIETFGMFLKGTNILVKESEVTGTNSDKANATGIKAFSANNVVIQDTDVFTTTAPGFVGSGIVFDAVVDSKILRCQVHENQNDGVQLTTTSLNNLVQDDYAVSNGGIGFNDLSTFANVWLGNKAQANVGLAYSGVASANIAIYSKSSGMYMPVVPSTPIFPGLTNISVIS